MSADTTTSPATYAEITYDVAESVATIGLNRPEARNGYTVRMADELASALDTADHDDDVRVVVLTGHGDDFCVGADLKGGFGDDERDDTWIEPAGRCSMRIFAMHKPVIAAIRGAAVGAGSTIILSADYRIASSDSRFGFVFTRRGIVPEGASTWFLPRLVGLGTALDWMISGRVFGADEALKAGLVHRLHPSDEVVDQAHALAQELVATTAPVSVALTRQLLYRMSPLASPLPVQQIDSRLIAACDTSADAREGVMSFLERRPPQFPGRLSADFPTDLPW